MTPEEAEQIASAGLYQFRNVYVLIFIWSLIGKGSGVQWLGDILIFELGVYLVAFAIGMHIIMYVHD